MNLVNSTFIGIPTYNGSVCYRSSEALLCASKHKYGAHSHVKHSVLTQCFNILFSTALTARKDGATHFCMLHADIAPNDMWLDKMHAIMADKKADVLSAVVPMKNGLGLTSTALERANKWRPRRLTMREVFQREPTFTDEKILLNSGLMLIDMRKPWVEKIWFRFEDEIIKVNDKFVAVGISEDWCFSMDAKKLGAKLFATREIGLIHVEGNMSYPNHEPWGEWDTDNVSE